MNTTLAETEAPDGELAGHGQLRVSHWNDAEQEAQQLLLLLGGQFHRRLLNVH